MDFFRVCVTENEKKGSFEVFPDFVVGKSHDLMIRGGSFYAIWDEEAGLWSSDEYDVQRLVDAELTQFVEKNKNALGSNYTVKYLRNNSSGSWASFKRYIANLGDNHHTLDQNLTFANTEVRKNDYVSKRLPYSLESGSIDSWDEIVGTLYSVPEREKIEWVIGAIVSGDSKKIQKFAVLYGPPAAGKGTILNIIERLFSGYTTAFDAKALGSANKDFATEAFKNFPLVAIQQDGDLSRIEDNTRLNSIVSHELMIMNEKYKSSYTSYICAFCLMGTNKPVKITDAKSGIIRRLIDIHPTGVTIPENHYYTLMARIDFELGAIAYHCLEVYRSLGKNHYTGYRPTEMMLQTDVFFNFIEANFDIFKMQDYTTLKQAYALYKEFCVETGIDRVLPQYKVREELRNYFDIFKDRHNDGETTYSSWYGGFSANKFKEPTKELNVYSLVLDEEVSLFDELAADWPAQYEIYDEDMEINRPERKWTNAKTTLRDLDTSQVHYVRVPEQHVVIDFDLTEPDGTKSLERNLEAASLWPATYAELSKSGNGIHLHYEYEGDVSQLANVYSKGIEVKTLLGDASLRRRLTRCNNTPVATYPGELPLKEKKVLDGQTIQNEKHLRVMIAQNLQKKHHPSTVSSIDFIKKLLDEAYAQGWSYDVSDLRPKILAFANRSTNQSLRCMKTVQQMVFHSDDISHEGPVSEPIEAEKDENVEIAFYDVEVYPNLFVICWKYRGTDQVQTMINPTKEQVQDLLKLRLVGFYVRRYDNHILYAASMGYTPEELFHLSQRIIVENDHKAMFGSAYGLSYADIWDFSSVKQSLKKFQIDLGLPHVEMDIPWDQPVPKDRIQDVIDYCKNDVNTTESVFEARIQDFVARQILAALSGLKVNDTTQRHTAQIIFEGHKNTAQYLEYTDLSQEFPGYTFDKGKSSYRGMDPSEGGFVYSQPGMYEDVPELDIESMHPTSIEMLNFFGPFTKNYSALKEARLAIKHGDYESARGMLNGKLAPFLTNEEDAKALSYALKIVINIVYGLTSASFDNPFRHPRNRDNIVAKRGALFMIDLLLACQEMGLEVCHIKTDSIKVPLATPEQIDMIMRFGEKYGYKFVHEATYSRFCLVNDAVYIAKKGDEWIAVGAQFQHPYVFKTLFSGEPVVFSDLCETKEVKQGTMYLDFEHERPEPHTDRMVFVGKAGNFVPVKNNGAILYRAKDEKLYAVTGTKGYLWVPADVARERQDELEIDMSYFERLAEEARKTIHKFGDFEWFVS